jgi:hypothetical protein
MPVGGVSDFERDLQAVARRIRAFEQEVWQAHFDFPPSRSDPDVILLPRATVAQLAYAVCY